MYPSNPSGDPSITEESLPLLIARARHAVLRMMEAELASLGVSTVHCMILLRLHGGGRNTAGALSRFCGIDSGAMTRLLDRLADKDLLARSPDTKDRRSVRVVLTHHAREMIPELQASVRRVHDRLLQYGEAEEVARVSAFLGDVIRRAAPPADTDTAT
jgi:DNA-binding MarR family transcriptional regulator